MQRIRTADGRYRYGYVGAGVKALFGLDPDDLMARPEVDHAWIHPEDRPRFLAALEASAQALTPLDEEVRVESPSGGYRWVRSIGHPRRQRDGTIIWDGVALDIHDRREAVETLSTMVTRVREHEAADDRLAVIAAEDVRGRLYDLSRAVRAFGPRVTAGQSEAFAEIETRLDALEQAMLAAADLAVTVDRAGQAAGPEGSASSNVPTSLTARQLWILRLVAEGRSNRDIGRVLGLSEGTVKQHMTRIFRRMRVQNRAEAVARLGSQA